MGRENSILRRGNSILDITRKFLNVFRMWLDLSGLCLDLSRPCLILIQNLPGAFIVLASTITCCETLNHSTLRSSCTGGAREVAGRAGAADLHRHRQRAHLWLRRAWSATPIHVHLLREEDKLCTRATTDPGRLCSKYSSPVESTVVGSLAVSAGLALRLVAVTMSPPRD